MSHSRAVKAAADGSANGPRNFADFGKPREFSANISRLDQQVNFIVRRFGFEVATALMIAGLAYGEARSS